MAIINQVVSGGGSAPAHYKEVSTNSSGKAISSSNIINLNGITDADDYVLAHLYYNNTTISGAVSFPSLTDVSGAYGCNNMFYGCTGLTSVDLGSLTTVTGENACGQMFQNCTGITSVDVSSLTTVPGRQGISNLFYGCTGITGSVDLSSLTTIGESGCSGTFGSCSGITSVDLSSLTTLNASNGCSSMFNNCTMLSSVNLSSLTTLTGAKECYQMFGYCTSLTSLSFPSITPNSFGTLTNQFQNLCKGITGITIHCPSNTQTKVSSLYGYSQKFASTNGSIVFDLPATNTLTGADTVTYTRNPKYDTATSLAWKVGAYGTTNFTPAYYTSGTTDPAVSDTIYSDAACTTAVTTISAIA